MTGGLFDLDDLADLDALGSPRWDEGTDAALFTTPLAVESIGKRVRAIAYTKPLHDLEANKVRLGGDAWSRLNMVELAFHAVDVVALRMDFDGGASYDDVVVAVATLAELQLPGLDDPDRVGEKVVEGLVTGRASSDAEAHVTAFGTWGDDGYVSRRYDFALLREHLDSEGEVCLRATDAAISVLVGALEMDLEGGAQAAELRIQRLVDRGLLDAAVQEARTARYRTIQYMDRLRRALSAARLHATEAGTLEAVDQLVSNALEHVVDRYRAEGLILVGVGAARDAAADERQVRKANTLIEQLRECQRIHQDLQRRLLTARSEFRAARAAQLAAPPNPPTRVDLERQLLRPLLLLPIALADDAGAALFARSTAPRPPAAVDPERLLAALSTSPKVSDGLGDEIGDEDELTLEEPAPRFTDHDWDLAEAVLGDVDEPTLLSAVLASVAALPAGAADLARVSHVLALLAVHALDPGVGEHVRSPERVPFLVAARTRQRFETEHLVGDDVLLARAVIAEEEQEADGGR